MKISPNSLYLLQNPQQIKAEIYRRSYYKFFIDAFKVLEPNTEFIDNWHIKYICDLLQQETERIGNKQPKTGDLIINIPPRSLKSKLITIIWNAWAWTKYPHLKFITASYSGDLAIEHSVETRTLIESKWYQEMFGTTFKLSSDQNVKSRFTNDKTGSRRATSVAGVVTGAGADIIICDDPLKVQDAYSDIKNTSAYDWWTKTMYSRLNDQSTGLKLIVMQRLSENDLTGRMLKLDSSIRHICLPASDISKVEPEELKDKYRDGLMFPGRFSVELLEGAKKSLGSLSYIGQYEQSPVGVEGNLIKRQWFKSFSTDELNFKFIKNFRTDTAYGEEGSDNSATICYSLINGNIHIWNVWKANLKFPDFIRAYKDFLMQNGYTNESKCYFEPKASGLSIIQQLERELLPNGSRINIIQGESPKDSKITRVMSASPTIEAGRIYLLQNAVWVDDFISECLIFPNGLHDDQVDVLTAIINEELNVKSKFGFAFG